MKSTNPKITQHIGQFEAIYNGTPWYGESICQIIEKINATNAYWQPSAQAHSIAQIIHHMIYWRQTIIKRLEGDLTYKSSMQSEDNWKLNEQLKKIGWKKLLRKFHESQAQLTSLLVTQNDAILKTKYSNRATFQQLINGIFQHDLYHSGQIAYLKSIYSKK